MSLPEPSVPNRKRRVALVLAAAAVIAVVAVLVATSWTAGPGGPGLQETPAGAMESITSGPSAQAQAQAQGNPAPSAGPSAGPSASGAQGTRPAGPASSAVAVDVPAAERQAAEANVRAYLAAGTKGLASPAPTPAPGEFSTVATGSAHDAMVAAVEDFTNNGWHQEGAPAVVSIKVTSYEPAATPPQATLEVCIDSSQVNVLTADGSVVRQGTAADRSLNILTVVKSGGRWLVSKEGFPGDPSC